MIGFRPIVGALLATAALGLTACGGDDEDAKQASRQLQEQGVEQQDADELAKTAQDLKEQGFSQQDAAKLKEATTGVQKEVTGLQQEILAITRKVQAGTLSKEEGNRRVAKLAEQIQRKALAAADELDQAGALPPSAKKQVEEARQRLQQAGSAGAK